MWLGQWRAKTLGTLCELPLRLGLPRVTVAVPGGEQEQSHSEGGPRRARGMISLTRALRSLIPGLHPDLRGCICTCADPPGGSWLPEGSEALVLATWRLSLPPASPPNPSWDTWVSGPHWPALVN